MLKLGVAVAEQVPDGTPALFQGKIPDAAKWAAELGYDALEVHVQKPGLVDAAVWKQACEQNGIQVAALASGSAYLMEGISLSHPDPEKRRLAVERMKEHIGLAQQLGAIATIGVLKGLASQCESREAFLSNYRDSLEQCIPYAEERGVVIAMECVNRMESDMFNTIAECARFARSFHSKAFRIYIDTYHLDLEESNIPEAIRGAADMIAYAQISDRNRRYPDGKHCDMRLMTDTLKELDYRGYLSLECRPEPSAQEAARQGLAFMRSLLREQSYADNK